MERVELTKCVAVSLFVPSSSGARRADLCVTIQDKAVDKMPEEMLRWPNRPIKVKQIEKAV